MRKIVGIIGVIVALALSMPCFAKNTQNVYIIKNQSIETVTKELQKSLTNSAVSNDVIYSVSPEFYYFRAYQSDSNVNIYMVTDKVLQEKYVNIVKNLPQKTYTLTDKDLLKTYHADLQKFITLNNVQASGVKVDKNAYNPYDKPLKNKVIKTITYSEANIDFKANKLQMKSSKLKRYNGYEIIVTNNTGANIVLKQASTGDFVGLTEVAKKVVVPNGIDFIPIYGIIAGAKTDVEKNKFTRPFPKDYVIKNGESVRLLGIAKTLVSPIIDFTFEVKGKEKGVQFNTYQ